MALFRMPYGHRGFDHQTLRHFPHTDGPSGAILASKNHALLNEQHHWRHNSPQNYMSFYVKDGQLAQEEIQRIEGKGFIETFKGWGQVKA